MTQLPAGNNVHPISIALGDGNTVRLIVTGKAALDLSPDAAKNLAAALTAFSEIARLSKESEAGTA